LECDVFEREYRCELPTCRRRTEYHLRSEHQGGGSGFGVQDAEVGVATMHTDHHRDESSRFRETDILGKGEHLLEGASASIPVETLERSRELPSNSSHYSPAGPEVEVHRRVALRSSGDGKSLPHQEGNEDSIIKE